MRKKCSVLQIFDLFVYSSLRHQKWLYSIFLGIHFSSFLSLSLKLSQSRMLMLMEWKLRILKMMYAIANMNELISKFFCAISIHIYFYTTKRSSNVLFLSSHQIFRMLCIHIGIYISIIPIDISIRLEKFWCSVTNPIFPLDQENWKVSQEMIIDII